ncbi:MAG TPA: 50S ribosomal protein L9 [Patescibacteria group bacterium]|nr:50S ribosomal protein L9 [Patescibacteria group bacterium]
MKILLIQNVDRVGKKGEVKEVANGFAGNFLFPRGLAVIATERVMAENKIRQDKVIHQSVSKKDDLGKNLNRLKDKTVTTKVKASAKGTLFQSIGSKEIVRLIEAQLKISLPEKAVKLDNSLKELGEHQLKAAAGDKAVNFKLKIEPDGQ